MQGRVWKVREELGPGFWNIFHQISFFWSSYGWFGEQTYNVSFRNKHEEKYNTGHRILLFLLESMTWWRRDVLTCKLGCQAGSRLRPHKTKKVAGKQIFGFCEFCLKSFCVLTCSVRDMLDAGKVLPCKISSNCWGHSWNWDFKNLRIFYFRNIWNLFIIWIPAWGGQYQA